MTLSTQQSLEIALSAAKTGQWDEAHAIVSKIKHPVAYEIHAYLHRKAGDTDNAIYWYRRAGIHPYSGSFIEEYFDLEKTLQQLKQDNS